MRNQENLLVLEAAPAAKVSAAMLEKVDRPVEFVAPTLIDNFTARLIDDHEGARLEQGIHEPIIGAYEAVALLFGIEAGEKHQRELTPALDHAADIGGAAQVESGVEREGYLDLAMGGSLEADNVSARHFGEKSVGGK